MLTAKDAKGFWLQDPTPDANPERIVVDKTLAPVPTVNVGDTCPAR